MVERESAAELNAIFHALSDPTRRRMLHRLSSGETSISDLAMPFSMSFAGASKHVRVLEKAGLVRRRIAGRTHLCRLETARLAEAQAWFKHYERFWTGRLEALDALLKTEDEQKGEDK